MILEDILIQAGVEYSPANTPWVSMPCPLCTGNSDVEGTRKVLGINLVNGKAHCFRCDFKSNNAVRTAKMLCEAFGIGFSWRLRASAAVVDETAEMAADKKQAVEIPKPVGLPPEFENFTVNPTDSVEKSALAYLRSRGVGRLMIHQYGIGFAAAGPMAWRIIFPVFGEDGKVYGYAGRDFSGQSSIKYLNSVGNKILWGANQEADTAVVVEGVMDGITGNVYLGCMPRTIAVAALGSAVTSMQVAQLAKFKRVIHFPDADRAGVKGAIARAERTADAGIETLVVVPGQMSGSDPDSMSEQEFLNGVRNAYPWNSGARMRLRLAALK